MWFIMTIYEIMWMLALPALIFIPKLKAQWKERLLIKSTEKRHFDIWIHAASVGECYILLDVASHLERLGLKIVATTNTEQGKEILSNGNIENLYARYLPFDFAPVLKKAISVWNPKLVVLIETELWPALLYTCKKRNIPVLIINGRLSEKSFTAYRKLKRLWRKISPAMIYAISEDDAQRYREIFGEKRVALMNNIKFDRIKLGDAKSSIKSIIPKEKKIIVLGSVRKEEENDLLWVIQLILRAYPDCIIALFPRHMDRIEWWKNALREKGLNYKLRSEIKDSSWKADVLLWDKIGELSSAYAVADSVFVGGSLKPCGGQNFLEPLAFGVTPCVGPFIENFKWVGRYLFDEGLVIMVKDKKELARCLIQNAIGETDREGIKKRFQAFLASKKGGTKTAVSAILNFLN